jgi:uncharacterized membrane protein
VRKLHGIGALLRAELRAASSLIPLIVLSVLFVFALTRGGVTLAYPAFQSPQSPQSPVGPPAETPTTPPPAAATATPTEPSVAPTPEAPVEPPPEGPAEPTPEGPAEPQDTPTEGEPPQEAAPEPGDEEEPSGPPNSPAASFIDTCVLGFSYVWLCCGGVVLLLFVLGVAFSFLLRRA